MYISVLMRVWDRKGLLQESGLVFVLHMGSELDLSLNPSKLAGFIKGDWMGAIQYVVPGLEEDTVRGKGREQEITQSGGEGSNYKSIRIS